MSRALLLAAGLAIFLASPARPADPELRVILPRGAQRGTTVNLKFRGQRLADAKEILWYQPGIEVTKIKPSKNGKALTVTAKIAADCPLGEHVCHVRTASGLSEFRTFWVCNLPAIAEKEPNNTFETPQAISYGKTVEGDISSEDVDYYVVEAKKGQRISIQTLGLRLATQFSTQFDPTVAILDEERFEVAAADDTALVHEDAVASFVAPKDGKYVIQIHDAAFGGNRYCHYRLHVGHFPRPLAVYPPGGKAGSELKVTYIGDPTGEFTATITLPSDPRAPFQLIPEQDGLAAPSPNPFRVSSFGNVLEQEPNNTVKEASGPAKSAPIALNGILAEDRDVDYIKFTASKGERLHIECYARRLRTPVDAVIAVRDAKGKALASDDDSPGSPDPILDFTAPKDGTYYVSIRDHLYNSGPEYVYRIEITPRTPQLSLSTPRVQRYRQTRQQVTIPRGGHFAMVINASRRSFPGEIILAAEGLPEGVSVHFEPMHKGINSMMAVFSAAADAPLGGALVDLKGFQKDGSKELFGRFSNTGDMVHYRNNLMLWQVTTMRLPVAVVEDLPFSLKIVKPKVPLVRDGELGLKIVAEREKGFDEAITVQFPFRPPGVGTLPTRQIPKGKNSVLYPLNANGNAQMGPWSVAVVGYANVSGRAVLGSPLTTIEIADNLFTIKLNRGATIQGESVVVGGTVNIKSEFAGKATAELLGLPNEVTAEPITITKETKKIQFEIKTSKKSPTGRHKGLICRVTLPKNGEKIVWDAGKFELRIDEPPPEPKKKVEQKKEPKKKTKEPLSRLEKLRRAAKQRREATSGK